MVKPFLWLLSLQVSIHTHTHTVEARLSVKRLTFMIWPRPGLSSGSGWSSPDLTPVQLMITSTPLSANWGHHCVINPQLQSKKCDLTNAAVTFRWPPGKILFSSDKISLLFLSTWNKWIKKHVMLDWKAPVTNFMAFAKMTRGEIKSGYRSNKPVALQSRLSVKPVYSLRSTLCLKGYIYLIYNQ